MVNRASTPTTPRRPGGVMSGPGRPPTVGDVRDSPRKAGIVRVPGGVPVVVESIPEVKKLRSELEAALHKALKRERSAQMLEDELHRQRDAARQEQVDLRREEAARATIFAALHLEAPAPDLHSNPP